MNNAWNDNRRAEQRSAPTVLHSYEENVKQWSREKDQQKVFQWCKVSLENAEQKRVKV